MWSDDEASNEVGDGSGDEESGDRVVIAPATIWFVPLTPALISISIGPGFLNVLPVRLMLLGISPFVMSITLCGW